VDVSQTLTGTAFPTLSDYAYVLDLLTIADPFMSTTYMNMFVNINMEAHFGLEQTDWFNI